MTTALIDQDILHYAIGFTTQDVDDGSIVIARIEDYVQDRFQHLNCDNYIFFRSGSKNFRKDINPLYKANRTADKPRHFNFIRDYLDDTYGGTFLDPYEADDLLGMTQTEDTVICSRDKDLLQIPGHHFDLHSREFCFITEEEGLKWFYTQLLTGDRVDNVIGLDQIGPARARKLLIKDTSEQEMWETCKVEYAKQERTYEDLLMNARMLWILREPLKDDMSNLWNPPE